MATDLSTLIKETLYSTLEVTLSTDIKENKLFTCNQDCLNGKNIVSISSIFTFENLTTNINFIFPAYFASYTFNTMMMEEAEPSLDIDDDIADALKEVTAQISGSLETAINALGDDSLGTCKYNAGDLKVELGDNYSDTSNLISITFTTNEKDFEVFINFDDDIVPYVEEFLKNELKIIEIEPLDIDETKIEESNQDNVDTDDNTEQVVIQNEQEDTKEEVPQSTIHEDEVDLEIDEDLEKENKKNKKIKMIIIGLASLLTLVIIAFTTLYFTGFFDPAPIIKNDQNKTKPSPQDIILANIKNQQITYRSDMIDVKKLNRRLALLTKYEIMETDILEEYKKLEKERLYKLKMKSLEEFALKNKEESIFKKDLVKSDQNEYRFSNDNNKSLKYNKENELITLIQIDALIYNKYSSVINLEKTKSTSISMCKNKNDKTFVYIGPLYINTLINNIVKKVGKKDAKLLQIKRKEFNKMCDF